MPQPYNAKSKATDVANDLAANIRGKTVLTTGVTPNSLGSHFNETIAAHEPALLILASRSQETIDATTEAIHKKNPNVPVRSIVVDLSSLASVRQAADKVIQMQKEENIAIDVLLLNAGIMACEYGVTTDGFERQFGTNHLGHFVFGNRIIPGMLEKSKTPRVVVVSSEGHMMSPIRWGDIGFSGGETYQKWFSYGQAKTANCLYAKALADKLGNKGLLAFSLHPGAIKTNLSRHMDMEGGDFKLLAESFAATGNPQGLARYWDPLPYKSLEEGTSTHVVAAFADGLEKDNGRYLQNAQIASYDWVSSWARNSIDAERLWKLSEELTGEKAHF